MKNEKNKRSFAHNKTQKKRVAEEGKEIGTDPPSSCKPEKNVYLKNGQMLPAVEVIMQNEKNKRSVAHNKTQNKIVAKEDSELWTDSPSSEGQHEK